MLVVVLLLLLVAVVEVVDVLVDKRETPMFG
jgi:hypothetical protein